MPSQTELYLVRHGIAAARGDAWPDDAKRPLVHKGVTRLRRETEGLSALGVTFDVVLTSPLTRARQTAELIAEAVSGRPPVHAMESLSPGGTHASFLEELAKYAKRASRIACVGHEPDLGQLASRLIGARRPLEFKKGAICRIDLDGVPLNGPGHLRWFVTPRMLRRSAR
jgi:phosphohistidine phosphatase